MHQNDNRKMKWFWSLYQEMPSHLANERKICGILGEFLNFLYINWCTMWKCIMTKCRTISFLERVWVCLCADKMLSGMFSLVVVVQNSRKLIIIYLGFSICLDSLQKWMEKPICRTLVYVSKCKQIIGLMFQCWMLKSSTFHISV